LIITWDPGLVYRDECVMTPFLACLLSTGVCLPEVHSTSFVKEEKKPTLLFQNWSGRAFSPPSYL